MRKWIAAVCVLACIAVALAFFLHRRPVDTTYDARADRADQVADSLRHVVGADSLRAAEAEARASKLSGVAVQKNTAAHTRILMIRDTTPESVANTSAVAVRDTLIDQLQGAFDSLEVAYDAQGVALKETQHEAATLRTALDSTQNVLHARPRPHVSILPRVGFGGFTGICSSGPCIGVGVTLSWGKK